MLVLGIKKHLDGNHIVNRLCFLEIGNIQAIVTHTCFIDIL